MAKITIPNKTTGDTHTATEFNTVKDSVNALYATAEGHNSVLTFDKNKYTATAIVQSSAINYTLAGTGNVDGTIIRHKILSDGVSPINFSADFNVFSKPDDNIFPSGTHIFYFNYLGGEVDVSIPTYTKATITHSITITSPTEGQVFTAGDNITITTDIV